MIATVEVEGQADQVAELRFVLLQLAVRLLGKAALQAQVGELLVQVGEGMGVERPVHADGEQPLEPAAGVVVAVEVGDFHHRLFGRGDQLQQVHVAGQDVAVFLQLLADEVQRILPVAAFRRVEQHHRHDRTLAGLDQGQHFQRLVQGAEAARAED
ncbi:hypothetical protein D3C78_1105010 [compost metagenome]